MKRDNDSKSLLRTKIRERQQVVTLNMKRDIAVRWTHEVFFQSPSPVLGEGFGVRAVPYGHENRYNDSKS
ncbi:MAG: hypothetical protein ACRC8Y_15510 [Chroococcales cyanobacterium]